MFNALRSDELLLALAQVLRLTAASRSALDEYERSQLLSALSVARLLAAEERAEDALLSETKAGLDAALAPSSHAAAAIARARVAAATDGVAVGDALADLLDELPADDPARAAVRTVLRDLADREVAALGTAS